MAEDSDRNRVKTARTTFAVLEELKRRDGATVTELSDAVELSNSSVHNYLTTLEEDGYVVREGDAYRLGLRFLDFGGRARRRERLYEVARDEVTALARETGELANLLVEEHGRGIYLHRAYGEDAVGTDSHVGQRVHLHDSALGKAILAHLPRERVRGILDRHGMPATTENTVTDRDELFEELERVRERGFALDDEGRVKGLRCVAVPIVTNDGAVEGAISVSGPTSRFGDQRFREALPARLESVANVIELDITYA
ncbi:IclR family transcriptional regulator [Halomicrobium salinisoli]|uniref:IclR family transcriptional regulator n=1 Tax=Halomicrobium salinisoli TaxID=2878391 RepID=UPI001CEFBB7D|nr:IclR family transcriptional regulator [Halomicrobium salinisoli]